MTLERRDWEEPACCLSFGPRGEEAGPAEGGSPASRMIGELDRLLGMDKTQEAGDYLENCLRKAEAAGDWAMQVTILNEMMGFYRSTGECEKGLQSAQKGLALLGEHGLTETVSGGTTYINAATTMKAFGKAGEAIPCYEHAFRVYGRCLSPGDYRFGSLFNNMALAYEDEGDFERAEAYYRQALAIMEGLRPGSVLEIALTWINLAVLYEKWGHEEEIDGCLALAAEGFHSEEAVHDAYYAFNCRKSAATFGHFGYFRMKKELTEEAERIYAAARQEAEKGTCREIRDPAGDAEGEHIK